MAANIGEQALLLSDQLTALWRRTAKVEQLVGRLSECDGATAEAQALAKQIQQELADLARDEQHYRRRADEQDRDLDRDILLEKLKRQEELRKHLQRKYREAVLQCHANEERSMAAKRRELLGDPARVRDLQQQQTTEALLKTAAEVTRSIERTTRLLHQEVERSAQANRILSESSQQLGATQLEHRTLGGVMSTGRVVLNQLFARERMDRILVGFALLLFGLAVAYVVRNRLFRSGGDSAAAAAAANAAASTSVESTAGYLLAWWRWLREPATADLGGAVATAAATAAASAAAKVPTPTPAAAAAATATAIPTPTPAPAVAAPRAAPTRPARRDEL